MFRITFCLKRLPTLTREEFQDHWLNRHAELLKQHAKSIGVCRYVQSHTVSDANRFPGAKLRGSQGNDYDGVAQLWWTDRASFVAAGGTEEARVAAEVLLADEMTFIDLENSPIFLSEDHEIIS